MADAAAAADDQLPPMYAYSEKDMQFLDKLERIAGTCIAHYRLLRCRRPNWITVKGPDGRLEPKRFEGIVFESKKVMKDRPAFILVYEGSEGPNAQMLRFNLIGEYMCPHCRKAAVDYYKLYTKEISDATLTLVMWKLAEVLTKHIEMHMGPAAPSKDAGQAEMKN